MSVDKYLQFIKAEFESIAEVRNLKLNYHNISAANPTVTVDLYIFEIAILNILSNAFKYAPSGNNIDLTLKCEGPDVIIGVRNSGSFIPMEERSRIFDRFYHLGKTKPGDKNGMGIGLSLAKQAVALLDGEIKCESGEDSGTLFQVRLPSAKAGETSREIASIDSAAALIKDSVLPEMKLTNHIEIHKGKPTVLIVEDNADLLEFIYGDLNAFFNTMIAADGRQALEILKSCSPDIIISDIMMPEMDGLELFKELKKAGKNDIPFLFLTARADAEEKIEALENGALDYIYKPFSIEELRSKINSILEQNARIKGNLKNELKEKVIRVFEEERTSGGPQFDLDRVSSNYKLSPREKQALSLAITGLQDKEIADKLNIAVSTVSNTLSRIYKKTGTSGRVGLLKKLSR